MHRTGARLLAVENKPRMEAMQRRKTGDALEAGITDNTEGAVGTSPLAGTSNAGVINPGVSAPIGGANDSTALKGATDTTLGTHVKVVTDRSMLFAVPVSWLSVAEVDHRVTDSRPISRPMQALGRPRRGPRAVEAETTALVWLREDIARDHGLLDDTTFPDEARTAWDDQAKAAADLAAAEKSYYDARAKAREAWLDLSDDQRTALGDDGRATVLPRPLAESPAVTAWQAARDDVRRRQDNLDAAAKDHHRLHLAAARLTAHHQGSTAVPVKDAPQTYTTPDWRSEAPEPYKVTDATGADPRTLTSPDGRTVHQVHEVPHDGASFFHALLATAQDAGRLSLLLGPDLAGRFTSAPGDPSVTADAVEAARNRLAWALGDNGNEDLLDGLALDAADTFTQAELDFAEIDLTDAQQAEFDAFGRLPQTVWPSPEQRVALAMAALSRPFAPEPVADPADGSPADGATAPPVRRAGDHGGADLLPALAARVLGAPVTVVTGEGRPQTFLPHGADPATADPASGPVLFAADGFFSAALAPGATPPATTALPAPPTTGTTDGGTTGTTAETTGGGGTTGTTTGTPPAPGTTTGTSPVPGTTTGTSPAPGTTTGTSPAPGTTEATPKPPAHRTHATPPWLPPADATGPATVWTATGSSPPPTEPRTPRAPRPGGATASSARSPRRCATRPGSRGATGARRSASVTVPTCLPRNSCASTGFPATGRTATRSSRPRRRSSGRALRRRPATTSTVTCAATSPTPRGARKPTVRWRSGRPRRPGPPSSWSRRTGPPTRTPAPPPTPPSSDCADAAATSYRCSRARPPRPRLPPRRRRPSRRPPNRRRRRRRRQPRRRRR